jgi:hypothetical protein
VKDVCVLTARRSVFYLLSSTFYLLFALAAWGQAGVASLGVEYRIAGSLPGDQVMPGAAVSAGGGYVVWQDKNVFGDRFSIMGKVLDGGLQGALAPFRVNSSAYGDHENGKVALLNNGGAVFVWQGGVYGFQHVYARFLSPSNTWLGLDVMVNSSAKIYQANPAVAVLGNGNVVIVYASYNTNTMQDVYGQIFSPDGQKTGGEFQLNHETLYNQRSPAVAALSGGGFVTAWVSEQQRNVGSVPGQGSTAGQLAATLPSVDIYARLFDAGGTAGVAEFLVNSSSNACANPVVASASDGSVIFAWSAKDALVRNNGWDIFARPATISPGGLVGLGAEQRVNTQLYGDQFAPRIAAQRTNDLVVWNSMGQDGSAGGIYGQALNADGSHSGGEFQVNSTTLGAQQEPAVAADDAGRFLAVWTSPTYTSSKNDLFAQVYAGENFSAPSSATNYAAPAFVGETSPAGGATGSGGSGLHYPYYEPPTLDYPGVITHGGSGLPAANAFTLAAGTYNGLFYENTGVSPGSAGSVSVKVNKDKTFSGTVSIGGKAYSLGSGKNQFDDFGATTKIVARAGGLKPLVVSLQLDLFGGDQIRGAVKAGNDWNALLLADRQTADASVYAGTYNIILPAGRSGPAGSGYGTVTISAAGVVKFSGKLADGTAITPASTLSKSGIWPLYYNAGGELVMSWIQFNVNPPGNDSGGSVVWIKPALASAKSYPKGFTNEVAAVAGLNLPAAQGIHQLHLSNGGLSPAADYSFQIGPNNKVTNLSANKLNLTVSATGVFTGSAAVQSTGKTISFQGALLKGGGGEGFFMNGSQSGQVKLEQP